MKLPFAESAPSKRETDVAPRTYSSGAPSPSQSATARLMPDTDTEADSSQGVGPLGAFRNRTRRVLVSATIPWYAVPVQVGDRDVHAAADGRALPEEGRVLHVVGMDVTLRGDGDEVGGAVAVEVRVDHGAPVPDVGGDVHAAAPAAKSQVTK